MMIISQSISIVIISLILAVTLMVIICYLLNNQGCYKLLIEELDNAADARPLPH